MAERPILFKTPMVKATLEGRKTQTRRTKNLERINENNPNGWRLNPHVPFDPEFGWTFDSQFDEDGNASSGLAIKPPYAVGDHLWVKETFALSPFRDLCFGDYGDDGVIYKANDPQGLWAAVDGKWTASIFMPKSAARIWLEVTGVRVERLWDITCADRRLEGVECPTHDFPGGFCVGECRDLKWAFRHLWNSINGPASWESNPWVWVIEFKVLSTNGRPS